MFIPCIIKLSRNNQHYALISTTPLFYILATTCFGSSLPLSGSFLDPFESLEIQIEWVVNHIMCGYVACVPECRGSVCCASQLKTELFARSKTSSENIFFELRSRFSSVSKLFRLCLTQSGLKIIVFCYIRYVPCHSDM
jgi:hypothetical protein